MNTNVLPRSLTAYLAIREALGFRRQPTAHLLTDFVGYVTTQNLPGPIRAQQAVDGACSGSVSRTGGAHAARLSVARGFLAFLRASAPETEVPDPHLLATPRRPLPYLFTATELMQLLETLQNSPPSPSLCPLLWPTLCGLLASTGLRIGEALRLTEEEVVLDTDPPHLRIVETKFHKSRIVPLHPSTTERLRVYATQRHDLGYHLLSDVFFPARTGKPLPRSTALRVFQQVTRQLGMKPREGGRTPSLQCLRHTFAVNRLRTWYEAGLDVQELLPHLSVYLGHFRPQESYWYLTATPELLTAAAERFQRYAETEGGLR
jgi:integrase/recombinase XerD